MMKVVIAIDSFKGCLSSMDAGLAAAEGVKRAVPSAVCTVRPLADGGEGTVDALVEGLGGELRKVSVTGPAGKPVMAKYGLVGMTAVMEMAEAAGITLVSGAERDAFKTTTYGVGEMILDAVKAGAKSFVIGIGGSATNDAGAGMLQALGWRLLDADGNALPRGGASLSKLATIAPPVRPFGCSFHIACDVKNPLCGPQGASAVFGPQKGATDDGVRILDAALAHFASVAGDTATSPGDGAAGGLGFAFRRFLGAELVPGADLVLRETRLADYVKEADVVITGEGRLDGQSVMGKAPIGVARLAKLFGKPVFAFSGCVGDGAEAVNAAGIDAFFPILRKVVTQAEAMEKSSASANLTATVEQSFRAVAVAMAGGGVF